MVAVQHSRETAVTSWAILAAAAGPAAVAVVNSQTILASAAVAAAGPAVTSQSILAAAAGSAATTIADVAAAAAAALFGSRQLPLVDGTLTPAAGNAA